MKLVDVAIFTFPSEAAVLESLLDAEKIQFSLNNPDSAIFFPGTGTILSVKKRDEQRVREIMQDAGFDSYLLPEN